jgi:uncharacterized repeat protein (TIGR01451 family)
MKLFKLFALLMTFQLVVFAQNATAEEPLVVTMEAYLVQVTADGEESLTPTSTANPGDIILYRAVFKNEGVEPLRMLQPVIPVPAGLRYVSDSGLPEPSEVSLDGSNFQAFPPVDFLSGQPLNPQFYRALRWQLDELAPGDSFEAELRARLSN